MRFRKKIVIGSICLLLLGSMGLVYKAGIRQRSS